MENEMMNNMEAMNENLVDAMPEVEDLVPSVDTNDAEMPHASGNFGKTVMTMVAGAVAYKAAELVCVHVIVPLWGKLTTRFAKKQVSEEIMEAEATEVNDTEEE